MTPKINISDSPIISALNQKAGNMNLKFYKISQIITQQLPIMNSLLILLFFIPLLTHARNSGNQKVNCPTDEKTLMEMVQKFENREACKRMTLNECNIILGTSVAGVTAVAGSKIAKSVMAKRALYLGANKAPSVNFTCSRSTSQFHFWNLILTPVYALNVCSYTPRDTKKDLADYVRLSEEHLRETIDGVNKRVAQEAKSAENLAARELLDNDIKKALQAKGLDGNKGLKLLDNYYASTSNKDLSKLTPTERKLLTDSIEAYNRMKTKMSANGGAQQELDSIMKLAKSDPHSAQNRLSEWSRKYKISGETADSISQSIESIRLEIKKTQLAGAHLNQLTQVKAALSRGGSEVTQELLGKVPLVDNYLSPEMMSLRNTISTKAATQVAGIRSPMSAFSKYAVVAPRAALEGAKRIGSKVLGMGVDLALANNSDFIWDHQKACLNKASSESGQFIEQLVDLDEDCKGSSNKDSDKYAAFLALPTTNKVDLLKNNNYIRQAYCSSVMGSPITDSYNIQCLSNSQFKLTSPNAAETRIYNFTQQGNSTQLNVSVDGNYYRMKKCPTNYQYSPEQQEFTAVTTNEIPKACSVIQTTMNDRNYDALKIADCCSDPSQSEFCGEYKISKSQGADQSPNSGAGSAK